MPKITDAMMHYNMSQHLETGETLQHWAFGVKQPSILIMLPLFALAILPGILVTQRLTKNYLVGLTDKRLIVLKIKGITNAQLLEKHAYALADFKHSPAQFKQGPLFSYITIDMPDQPFSAKFHRMMSKDNRRHAEAIGTAISAP